MVPTSTPIRLRRSTTFFEHLRDAGFYVIEDSQTSSWPGPFGGAHISDPAFAQTCTGELLELAKYLNHAEFQNNEGIAPGVSFTLGTFAVSASNTT